MKYKLLAMLLAAAMLVSPVLGFFHVPPPPTPGPTCTTLGVLINDEWTTALGVDPGPYNFTEPDDHFCNDFTVKVVVYNVTDLFGYEFNLTWDTYFFNLKSYTVEDLWPGNSFQVKPAADYDLSSPYMQVVSAVAPATGLDGDFLLATLVFHINNDVSIHDGIMSGTFGITGKLSNSCTGNIETCTPYPGYWQFIPVEPEVVLSPDYITCSKVGTTFEVTVWLEDIVKMTDFCVNLAWDPYWVANPCDLVDGGFWTQLLYTTEEDIVINEAVFPTAWRDSSSITVNVDPCGAYEDILVPSNALITVCADMNATYPLINGTIWLFKVTFVQCDAWYCGAQPSYLPIDKKNHLVTMENASTLIYTVGIGISLDCYQGPTTIYWPGMVSFEDALYVFKPIPGDLDGSGHTGIEDLMILAARYGEIGDCVAGPTANAWSHYYDLTGDGVIDIYDLVLLAKNFCRDIP